VVVTGTLVALATLAATLLGVEVAMMLATMLALEAMVVTRPVGCKSIRLCISRSTH
jgi:hypothetical protein